MATKVSTDKVRKSLLMNKTTCDVISATAKLYNCSFSEMLNRIADNFAKQNLAAVSIVEKMQQSAFEEYQTVAQNDFGGAGVVEVEVDGEGGDSRK